MLRPRTALFKAWNPAGSSTGQASSSPPSQSCYSPGIRGTLRAIGAATAMATTHGADSHDTAVPHAFSKSRQFPAASPCAAAFTLDGERWFDR